MGFVSARRPGWLLEPACECRPRGMVAIAPRGDTEPGLQALWHFRCEGRWQSRHRLTTWTVMARSTRSADWGFPRWRGYGAAREATQVRMCDRYGCDRPGNCPAPKSPNGRE